MDFVDWTLCPNNVTFDYDDGYFPPALGRKPTRNRSPNWFVNFRFPDATEDKQRLLDGLKYQSPQGLFNIADPSRPYPMYWKRIIECSNILPADIVPRVTVSAMDAAARTITISGEVGDVITVGDPLAFTQDGYRYYFRAGADLQVTGGDQPLPVIYEPLRTLSFAAIDLDRISPTMRFQVALNGLSGSIGLSRLAQLGDLSGVEWTKRVV